MLSYLVICLAPSSHNEYSFEFRFIQAETEFTSTYLSFHFYASNDNISIELIT